MFYNMLRCISSFNLFAYFCKINKKTGFSCLLNIKITQNETIRKKCS
jgi:hypothetical protein